MNGRRPTMVHIDEFAAFAAQLVDDDGQPLKLTAAQEALLAHLYADAPEPPKRRRWFVGPMRSLEAWAIDHPEEQLHPRAVVVGRDPDNFLVRDLRDAYRVQPKPDDVIEPLWDYDWRALLELQRRRDRAR